MFEKLHLMGQIGVVLLLLGSMGFFGGHSVQAQNDCVSGTQLVIEKAPKTNMTMLENNTTAFADLSPDEQRIFLQAYTDSADNRRHSDTYENWSDEWFDSEQWGEPRYVKYRSEYWELMLFARDCGLGAGMFAQFGGILSLALGGALLITTGIRRQWHTDE